MDHAEGEKLEENFPREDPLTPPLLPCFHPAAPLPGELPRQEGPFAGQFCGFFYLVSSRISDTYLLCMCRAFRGQNEGIFAYFFSQNLPLIGPKVCRENPVDVSGVLPGKFWGLQRSGFAPEEGAFGARRGQSRQTAPTRGLIHPELGSSTPRIRPQRGFEWRQ
jgi:hypothetical protein